MLRFLHRQQRNKTCAVACVRTVLHRQFGVQVPEAALVALGRRPTDPILTEGSDTQAIRRMVRNASAAYNQGPPWTLRVRSSGTFGQLKAALRRGRWPICQVYVSSEQCHHTVVVLGVTSTLVLVFDPDPSTEPNPRWMSRAAFQAWWTSPETGDTWYALVNGGVLKEAT